MNLQLEYAFDTNDDGTPEQYLTSTTADTTPTSLWSNVVALRLHMLMRSTEAANAATTSPGTYDLGPAHRRNLSGGIQVSPGDYHDAAEQRGRTPGKLR